ncbi:hypothetical protein [Pseudotenacibaculum haliotis]|uniref:Uncharacterized protein n=1 Tax=Pseudotenacibaculum haliotis TaxID=1862138 RepID=A0ABW5LLR1_9FLAO
MKNYTIIKTFVLLLNLSLSVQSMNAQEITPTKEDKAKLAREFARVATGNTFSSIGNFAAISTDNKTLSASAFFITDDFNVINIEISGGAINGIAAVFQEGRLNSKVSFGASYNVMLRKLNRKNNVIFINDTEELNLKLAIEEEKRKLQKKRFAFFNQTSKAAYNKEKNKLDAELLKIKNDTIQDKAAIAILVSNSEPKYKIKPLQKKIKAAQEKAKRISSLLEEMKRSQDYFDKLKYDELATAYRLESSKKVKDLEEKIKDLRPYASSFSWLSFGYKATNDSFSLFDESLPLSEQLSKQSYTSQTIFFNFNHQNNARIVRENGIIKKVLKYRGREYFSIGGKLEVTHNLSSLDQVEIVDTTIIDVNTGREKTTKQNAFSGAYLNDLTNGLIYADYFKFFSTKEDMAVHLNPTVLMRENFKPVSSFQIGILFPFKDKDKQKNTVNLEIFYRANDIFNTSNSKKSILNRNTIGLQAIFPFNF